MIPAHWRLAYENLSLQRKIALVLGGAVIMVAAAITLAAFLLSRHLLIANVQYTLETQASQKQLAIQLRLESTLTQARAIVDNSVDSKLLDSRPDKQSFLAPLLSHQKLPFDGTLLMLTDAGGRPVASNRLLATDENPVPAQSLLRQTLDDGRPRAEISRLPGAESGTLMLVLPVTRALSGQRQGAVILTIPLGALIDSIAPNYRFSLFDGHAQLLAGSPLAGKYLEASQAVVMPAPFDGIEMRVVVSQDRALALRKLDNLIFLFLIISALLLVSVTVFSRTVARFLTHPLRDVVAAAERISATGRPDAVLATGRADEFGRLAGALNTMLGRLNDAYGELEDTVEERTRALRAILDNVPFLLWLKDADGRFIIVNKAFAEACGQPSPEALVGLNDLDIWPEDLARAYMADDQEVLASGREKNTEEPVEIDGQRQWIETFKKPVIDRDALVIGTVGFARNITARKEMEARLAESEQRWSLAISGTNDGIWDWDHRTNHVFFSERWKQMLGYAPAEIGDTVEAWSTLVHPQDLPVVMENLARHLCHETDFYNCEFRMRARNGKYQWILARGKAIFDGQGNAIRILGSHTDISDRKLAEADLKVRTTQLASIFALSPDGFVAFGQSQHIDYVSPAFVHLTGISENTLVGKDEAGLLAALQDRCDSHSQATILAFDALKLAASGKPAEQRVVLELKRPAQRIIEVGQRSQRGEQVSKIFYLRDITHETEVDHLKSEFLSTAAHELRTPMASILGFSELLITNDEFDEGTRRELLQTIHRQSELMASIINELLDLARIEARRGTDFVYESVDLTQLARQTAAGMHMPNDQRKVSLDMTMTPYFIWADRRKVTQAMLNVLSNAYKYSPNGGRIGMRLVNRSKDGRREAGVCISDEGIGMTAEQLAKVCDRFYRADASGRILGTGLGMSIVKEIMDLLGGELNIQSAPGEGTRVTLWFRSDEHLEKGA
jgi:PAS domain S-box-containing protein